MASSYTTNLRLELQGTGDNLGTWGGVANNQFSFLDSAIGGMTSVAMVDGTNTLTALNGSADQSRQPMLYLYQTLTTVANVVVPATGKKAYYVWNNTAGSKQVTVKTPTGSGFVVPSSSVTMVYSDGVTVVPMSPSVDTLGNLSSFPTTVSTQLLTVNGISGVSAAWTQRITADSLRVNTSAYCSGITATTGTITTLGATTFSAASVSATNLNTGTLGATTGTFTSVATSAASATLLNATTASVGTLTATSANVTNLNVSGTFTGAGTTMAKAWASWTGATPTLLDSYNISGIRKISTGQFALSFTSAISHSNPVAVAGSNSAMRNVNSITTTSVEVFTINSSFAYTDVAYNTVIVF